MIPNIGRYRISSSQTVTGSIMVVSQNVLLPDRLRPKETVLRVVTMYHPSDLVALLYFSDMLKSSCPVVLSCL